MNIGVAILAALTNVAEDRLYMALCTGHGLMHAAQRIACLVMVELGDRTDGPPRGCGMAVLARDIQVSVRTMGPARNLSPRRGMCARRKDNYGNEFEYAPNP